MSTSDSDLLQLAVSTASAAGALLLDRFGGPASGVDHKSSATDPVSDADRDAEALIVSALRSAFPEDGLLGEEGAERAGTSGRHWIVDPLDGTVNYLYGNPAWGVSIACADADGMLVGVVYEPTSGSLFSARRGAGAWLGEQRLAVNSAVPLERALVATGFSYHAAERTVQATVISDLLPRVRDLRRGGSAALDLAAVAAGRVDAFFEHGLKSWDRAAGELLVTEAGGVVIDLAPAGGLPGGLVAASNAELAATLIAAQPQD